MSIRSHPGKRAVENVVDCQLKKQEQETVLRILSISHQRKKASRWGRKGENGE